MIALALPALAATAYYLIAIVAALKWLRWSKWGRRFRLPSPEGTLQLQPLSILKPIHGRDPHFYEAIRSHAVQDYPEFEILFGFDDSNDPALDDVFRLQREFPAVRIEAIVVSSETPNAKAGLLAKMAKQARYPWLLINDSDIFVEPGYLRAVAAPLANPEVGLVTCLYRGHAESWASRMEAIGVATEFAVSVMAARLLGQAEFALGSTMALSADTLRAAGGFEAVADYLADDYQLGKNVSATGRRIEFAPVVVETELGAESLGGVWRHQVRWSRAIRVSRPGGYWGYAVTHATVWALVAFAAGQWWAGCAALAARMIAAALAAIALEDRYVPAALGLVPLRDLFGFAVWLAGGLGDTVYWRGHKLKLRRDGKISANAG